MSPLQFSMPPIFNYHLPHLSSPPLPRVLHLSTSTHATLEVDRIDGLVSWT
jgi:hypothetical protein